MGRSIFLCLIRRSLALSTLVLAPAGAAAQGVAAPVGTEVSAGVVLNPHGPDARAVGLRRLTADECWATWAAEPCSPT